MKSFFPLRLVVGGLLLSACVTPQQIEIVEREQRHLRTETTAARSEADSMRTNLADTRANLDQMQRDLNALKEKVEEVRYELGRQIGRSSREGDQRVQELEGRLAKVDEELKMQGALLKAREEELRTLREAVLAKAAEKEAEASATAAPATELTRDKVSGESEAAKRDYEEAWRLLERKDYRVAVARFKDFLKKHPNSDYADNAQYWIGESYYALKEFDQAILEFDAVRRKYPKGDKVPAALLKQGFAFAELGDKVDARLILQELINRYPQSQEAVKAKQKLKALES
jgi:tol-pal system protein YbgF